MSDATEAWEKWYGNPDVASDTPSIAFAAGFVAGQVAALEDAAKDIIAEMVCCHIYDEAGKHPDGRGAWMAENATRYQNHDLCYWAGASEHLVRARAAELSKEQHDQPDPQTEP